MVSQNRLLHDLHQPISRKLTEFEARFDTKNEIRKRKPEELALAHGVSYIGDGDDCVFRGTLDSLIELTADIWEDHSYLEVDVTELEDLIDLISEMSKR